MDLRVFSIIFMIATFVIIIAVDIFLAVSKQKGVTFSSILRRTNRRWAPLGYMICFGFGLLAGHWFW